MDVLKRFPRGTQRLPQLSRRMFRLVLVSLVSLVDHTRCYGDWDMCDTWRGSLQPSSQSSCLSSTAPCSEQTPSAGTTAERPHSPQILDFCYCMGNDSYSVNTRCC